MAVRRQPTETHRVVSQGQLACRRKGRSDLYIEFLNVRNSSAILPSRAHPNGWLISHSRGGFKPGLHVRPSGGTTRFLRDLQVGVSTLARSMGLNLAVGPASKMDLSALYGYIPAGPAGMISRRDTTNLLHPCQVQPSLRSRSASASNVARVIWQAVCTKNEGEIKR